MESNVLLCLCHLAAVVYPCGCLRATAALKLLWATLFLQFKKSQGYTNMLFSRQRHTACKNGHQGCLKCRAVCLQPCVFVNDETMKKTECLSGAVK